MRAIHPLRRWTRRPGVAASAVLVLALGIGATTAVFSVVDAVLMPKLPWPAADRLVIIHGVRPDQRGNPGHAGRWDRAPISWAAWQDLRRSGAFDDVGVWLPQQFTLYGASPDVVQVSYVSTSFTTLLGLRPVLGRLFTADEDDTMSDVAVLSYEIWQRRFGGSSAVIGQTVALIPANTTAATPKRIVGVLAPSFRFQGESPDVLLPIGVMAWNGSFEANRFLRAVGRLSAGMTTDRALAIAEPLIVRLESASRHSARIVSLVEDQFGAARRPLWLMLTGAGLLLLIACSNVAGLLLLDASLRQNEMAVRVALGASRRQLVRQLAAEYLTLALASGPLGLLLASWLLSVLIAIAPALIQNVEFIAIDYRLAAWSLGLAAGTTFVFGLAPTLMLSAANAARLSSGGPNATGRRFAEHRLLVAGQVTLSVILLVGAALFGETVLQLKSRPLGFDAQGLVVASVLPRPDAVGPSLHSGLAESGTLPVDRNARILLPGTGWQRTARILEQLSALPGVSAAAGASAVPFGQPALSLRVRSGLQPVGDDHLVHTYTVSERYFEAMGIPVLRGRGFVSADHMSVTRPVLVSRELERRVLNGDALGKSLQIDVFGYDVIGIVGDIRETARSDEVWPALYLLENSPGNRYDLLLRTSGDPAILIPLIKPAIEQASGTRVLATSTMSDLVEASRADERFRATLSVVFALSSLLLTGLGIFGLTGRVVTARRREIGVRLALGASASNVRGLVLRDACATVGLGLAAGIPAAYVVSHWLRSLLFGVSPTAPGVFLGGVCAIAFAAAAAIVVPIVRAARIEPSIELRTP